MEGRTQTLAPSLPRPRDALGAFGLYVHVPFCAHRCWYCDFNAYAGLDHLADAYMAALVDDARLALSAPAHADLADRPRVTSIFIGGGTPSLVDARWIAMLLDAIKDAWPVDRDVEVTIECNPESMTAAKLAAYLDAGVNRVSIGVQSLEDELLARLGRLHDAAKALEALSLARRTGFTEVNADLIFGIPGEDDAAWRSSVEGVLGCEPTHVSCYALTYEEGTPLHSWRRLGKVTPVPDDDAARRWAIADEILAVAGLRRYEISNWARPGSEARHNGLYWACGEYLGVGAGAHSHLATRPGAVRSWTVKAPERYIREVSAGRRPIAGTEDIDQGRRAAEVLFCGLRRAEGVTAEAFRELTGRELADTFGLELAASAGAGLLSWNGRLARLTAHGTLLADDVLRRFV